MTCVSRIFVLNATFLQTLRISSSDESNSGEEDLSHELHLGRWCAKRTEIFHELCHWEVSHL